MLKAVVNMGKDIGVTETVRAQRDFSTDDPQAKAFVNDMIEALKCSKSPHIRTYQNKNLEAVFPKLCTLQLRNCFSLMKHTFLLQGFQSRYIFDRYY